jgi:hypothetical protein
LAQDSKILMGATLNTSDFFRRPELAKKLATQILYSGPVSAVSSGIFLAAPRHTGKSTFLREDFRPAVVAEGALFTYADLWADPNTDPGTIIVNTIRALLATSSETILRLLMGAGLSTEIMNVDRLNLGKDLSLTDALAALSDETKKMIVLVIDEAQHAITTKTGMNTLFALKAARDELNSSRHFGLRVVCVGSDRDKLATLRNSSDQAFFCAPMENFPLLGREFVEWFCKKANLAAELDPEKVWSLFCEVGYQPKPLGSAADHMQFDFGSDAITVSDRFANEVRRLAKENDLLASHEKTPEYRY